MRKRDKRRAAPARQTERGLLTLEELAAMLREARTRTRDGLADIPEDRCEYARRKEVVDFCNLTLRRIGG